MKHLQANLPAEAHTPMYNWHKYWARKTWNVVGQFVENYCPKDGIVLDPFSGSGVTAIEALRRGHRTIAVESIIISNDSDLTKAIGIITGKLARAVIVVNPNRTLKVRNDPQRCSMQKSLQQVATHRIISINEKILKTSQFAPMTLPQS